MAVVSLEVGGRPYELACRDDEAPRLRALAAVVDARMADATRMLGPTNEARRLLLAALMLADELAEVPAPTAPPPAADDDDTAGLAEALDRLAARLEKLAEALEPAGPTT